MRNEHFLRDANGNVLAVVTLTVAAIFGTIGLAISDDSFFDATQWSAVSTAHAVAVTPDSKDAQAVARNNATDARATGNWSADESAQGTRPDAAH